MAKFFESTTGIEWKPPGNKLRGKLTGIKHSVSFYVDDEETETQLLLFFNDGTVRPSVARLLECVLAWQEKNGNSK